MRVVAVWLSWPARYLCEAHSPTFSIRQAPAADRPLSWRSARTAWRHCACCQDWPLPFNDTHGVGMPVLATYIHTYVHTYIHTCVRKYVRTYIHTIFLRHAPSFAYNFVPQSHTTVFTSRSFTTSFVFPSFPVPLQLLLLIIGRSWHVGLSGPLIEITQLGLAPQGAYFQLPLFPAPQMSVMRRNRFILWPTSLLFLSCFRGSLVVQGIFLGGQGDQHLLTYLGHLRECLLEHSLLRRLCTYKAFFSQCSDVIWC